MSALIHIYILTYNTSGFAFTNASAEANSSSHFVDSVLITSKHSSQGDPLQNCLAILLTTHIGSEGKVHNQGQRVKLGELRVMEYINRRQ